MIRQKILQQLLEWIEAILSTLFQSKISHRNLATAEQHPASVPKFHACAFGRIHSQRRLCRAAILVRLTAKSMLDLHSLCILIHSSHSAANLKSYRLLSP